MLLVCNVCVKYFLKIFSRNTQNVKCWSKLFTRNSKSIRSCCVAYGVKAKMNSLQYFSFKSNIEEKLFKYIYSCFILIISLTLRFYFVPP